MFKQFLYSVLFFCLSATSFASLNESTKPRQITIYLDHNTPYSEFNSHQSVQGLYAEFWHAWSLKTGILVKMVPYLQQDLNTLLSTNNPAVYSGLLASTEDLKGLNKTTLLSIHTDFYYFSSVNQKLTQALKTDTNTIIMGGLLPQAQQLPLLMNKSNLIYKEYLGLLELLLDLYQGEIDAVVLFNIGKESDGLLDYLLSRVLQKTSIEARQNQLYTYLPVKQKILEQWLVWGNQFEQLHDQMRIELVKLNQPWWGASATMARNIFAISSLLFIFILISRSKRKKEGQFKDVLDSSPYPLAIFTLDGNTIFYLNNEVKSLFPFKKKNHKFIFEESENQLLLSRFINKASHQTVIENGLVRLLVDETFHDIEIFAKRIHYKRKTAWLCHLKDVTALLSAEQKLTEERALLRKVLDSIPEQISFKSPKGTIIGCNTAWAEVNNTTVANATGRSVADMMDKPVIKKLRQQESTVWTGKTYNTHEWIQRKNSVEMSLVNITKVPLYNDKGAIFAILSIDSDITALHNLTKQLKDENLQRKETEKALSKQSVLLSTVFAASYDPIGLLDHEGRIIGANNSFARLMNSTPENLIGKFQVELMASDRADWTDRQNTEVLTSGEPIIFEELLFVEGKKIWYEVHKAPFKDDESQYQGIVIMARDITTRKLTEEKLSSDASDFEQKMLNDQLTNIANRRSFDTHFTKFWQEAYDKQEMISIVMCDIDYFKPYNDNYGHQMGDETLKVIALALHNAASEIGCFAARYGGEEFVVIIKGGNSTKALRAVEKFREAINNTKVEHLHSDVSRYVTMSMGLSSIFQVS